MIELPSHSHSYAAAQRGRHWECSFGEGVKGTWNHGPYITQYGYHKADSSSVGGGQNHNNMPPFYILRYIVKQPTK